MSLKRQFLDFMQKPRNNVRSSQTLYEALLANINMYLATGEVIFKQEAGLVANMIVGSQLEDGGFDIGYNFRFGDGIQKSSKIQATTPECLSIYALIEYYKLEPVQEVKECIIRGIKWIESKAYINEEGYWVVPYAPDTIKQVYITNAISFCIGTIANYIVTFADEKYLEMYHSMCEYMLTQLTIIGEEAYWTYYEDKLCRKSGLYSKVDNYHIAQQLFYHSQAYKMIENSANKEIIQHVWAYLKGQLSKCIMVPYIYTNGTDTSIANIDMWGYCALLLCTVEYRDMETADKIADVILKNSWNGRYFAPVLNKELKVVDGRFYPRSDAWVVHALTAYYAVKKDTKYREVIETDLKIIHDCNYQGTENHALTRRKIILAFIAKILKKK